MKGRTELDPTVRKFRNLLPYLKYWGEWQREIRRLERNIVKLRRHRFTKLSKTLAESLPTLKSALDEERVEHAFTVNELIERLDKMDNRKAVGT